MRKVEQIVVDCGCYAVRCDDGTMWQLANGGWRQIPPISQPAPEPAWPDARTVCGEVYQVVGVLAERWPDCSLARVLDNLSAAAEARPVPHATLLPFVAPASPKVAPAPVTEAMVEAAWSAWTYSPRGTLCADAMRGAITAALQAQRGE